MDKPVKPLDLTGISDASKKRALNYAIEARKAEIDRFWARTVVFWGFVAATFVAFGALYDKANFSALLLICCFGFLASLAWTLQNRGSKYWQESWEKKVAILEVDVIGLSLFANIEPRETKGFWGAWRFSVSSLAIALSDLAALVWVCLAGNVFVVADPGAFGPTWGTSWFAAAVPQRATDVPILPTIIVLLTLLYGIALFKSYRPAYSN